MKKLFLALLFVGVAGSLSATQFVFADFDVTLLDGNGQTPPEIPDNFTVELGSFHTNLVPTGENVSAWMDAWRTTSSTGYYDPTGPEWSAALTLANNDQFAVGEQLYLWAYDIRSGASAQWALLTDPTWTVTASSGLDPVPLWLGFTTETTAILGHFDFDASTASLAAITLGGGSAVPESTTWSVTMIMNVAAFGLCFLFVPRGGIAHRKAKPPIVC